MTERAGARVPAAARDPGLSSAEVARCVERGEVKDVPVRSSRSLADIVRANVFTRFNAIIGVLFLIILVVGPIQDGLFGFVIIANTAIGIVQEVRAKRTLDNLAVIGEARPTVRRDGRATPVGTAEIVLGDVVELEPGDKVVVDGEVVEAAGLEIDESLLTGEADPVVKQPGDRVMSGSFVVAGGGAFTTTKVGRQAYAVQLAEEASRFTLVDSELRNGISRILKYVTWMMAPTAVGLVISQFTVESHDWREAVRRMVGGITPMVPEGLVLLTSVAFAIGVVRLGRKQCLVQELPAIEGLARVDVVCLDKTGTLTEGGMALTIGVPAFFLALAPDKERARPHFVRRVMRYATPAGIICGSASFVAYLIARHHYTGPGAVDAETSAATLTLFLLEVWVLAIVARPYTWWRIALVLAMGAGFLVVLVTPWLQRFFALRLVGDQVPWTAVGIAVVGGIVLELAWARVRRREAPA